MENYSAEQSDWEKYWNDPYGKENCQRRGRSAVREAVRQLKEQKKGKTDIKNEEK
ncbi:hypothetical protein [Dorea longicatena]|uniref:hypothetical protein n=1 Tax=Dorea TaxID=189330 RepID=UPI001642C623|nr:hypothetical protein [Dorea longicatena]